MIYDLNLKKSKAWQIVLNKGVSLLQYSLALQSIFWKTMTNEISWLTWAPF